MKTTYLKCHHGNELRLGCNKCEQEKANIYNFISSNKKEQDKKTPIFRGCKNQTCFCTGKCKEVIGYME